MPFHMYNVFMAGNPETLKNTKEKIKKIFNIQNSGKVKKFLGVYYKSSHDSKGTYAKMTMDKDAKKLVESYQKYTESDVKVQKISSVPSTALSKRDLEKPYNIDTYRSFVRQLM